MVLPLHAEKPFVSPVFGDHMVVQRDKPARIWGWSDPGKEITVKFGGQSAATTTRDDGSWALSIQAPPAGGPYTLNITGPRRQEIQDVLVGDVWLCSGQSNMELPMPRVRDAEQEIKAADHPEIRLFVAKSQVSYGPSLTPNGSWSVCSPASVTGFSAVGYYFGRKLQQELHVPIGLVQAAIGGTPAESWTSEEALRPLKDFDATLDEVRRLRGKDGPQYGNFISHWYDEFDVGQKEKWQTDTSDDSNWKPVKIPGGFRELGVPDSPAVCYFRKTLELPDPLPSGDARIELGVVERMDTTYLNGTWIGASAWVENPRVYKLGTDVLRPGRNTITVRVLKTKPDGGFNSDPSKLKLVLGDKTEVPLAGDWQGRVSVDAKPPHPLPAGYENWPTMPSVLYNGMIAPIAPLSIRGALWYQGEANAGRAAQYSVLLPAMITDWREAFNQGDFPFYIVSLAAFMPHRDEPGDDGWAELREAQAFTAATVPNSGLAIAIDKGDANDIHPKDKREIGERLALNALAQHYGNKIPFSGPTLKRIEPVSGALKIHFDHTDGGLAIKGDKLEEFSVCGDDGKWVWAEAKIVDDCIIVFSPSVTKTKHARYAWQSNPKATLFNGAGLPAVPFRTDSPCMKLQNP